MSITVTSLSARRWGVKGPAAAAWLLEQRVTVPRAPNTWSLLDNDPQSLILRLGSTEFFLEEHGPSGATARCQTLARELLEPVAGVYPVLREDTSLLLQGTLADRVLAEAGSFDFANLSVAVQQVVMTLLLGVAVIVIAQGGAARCYRIWCDPSYGTSLTAALEGIAADLQ
jgi:sarcosine oxidase subunit gamma